MPSLIKLVLLSLVILVVTVTSVSADGKDEINNGNNGNIDIPGQQDSKDIRDINNNALAPEESIENTEGEIKDGLLTVSLNFKDSAKFGVQTSQICSDLSNIVIETKEGVTGILKVSGKIQNSTEAIENVISSCRFKLEGFDNDFIKSVKWTIGIRREDLLAKKIEIDNVGLMILEDGEWTKVNTKKTDDSNSEVVYYEAQTNSFYDGEIVLAESNNFWSNIFTVENIAYFVISLVGLLVLVAIGYLLLKKEE
ncbi:hypothetical protein KBD45_05560 [Candidatus Dojkabacteria bacterium]|nr:hypothetical protein [Candidatus Dojkabacteria bacterium]